MIWLRFCKILIGIEHQHQHHHLQPSSGSHLQCWHCSSDTIGAESFCGRDFKESNIPNDQFKERNISVVRYCNSTIHSEHERAVCRKIIEESKLHKQWPEIIQTFQFCAYFKLIAIILLFFFVDFLVVETF